MERYHIIVYGKVQGVGFRRYTHKKAIRYQIKGWVCNKGDRTVEIVAQGTAEKMRRFIEAVVKGPKNSKVDRVEFLQPLDTKDYRKFTIRY